MDVISVDGSLRQVWPGGSSFVRSSVGASDLLPAQSGGNSQLLSTVELIKARLQAPQLGGRGLSRLKIELQRSRQVTLHLLWCAVEGNVVQLTSDAGGFVPQQIKCLRTKDDLNRQVTACVLPNLMGKVQVEWAGLQT